MPYCVYSDYSSQIISPIYDSLEELKKELDNFLSLDSDMDEEDLIVYKMEPLKVKVKIVRKLVIA